MACPFFEAELQYKFRLPKFDQVKLLRRPLLADDEKAVPLALSPSDAPFAISFASPVARPLTTPLAMTTPAPMINQVPTEGGVTHSPPRMAPAMAYQQHHRPSSDPRPHIYASDDGNGGVYDPPPGSKTFPFHLVNLLRGILVVQCVLAIVFVAVRQGNHGADHALIAITALYLAWNVLVILAYLTRHWRSRSRGGASSCRPLLPSCMFRCGSFKFVCGDDEGDDNEGDSDDDDEGGHSSPGDGASCGLLGGGGGRGAGAYHRVPADYRHGGGHGSSRRRGRGQGGQAPILTPRLWLVDLLFLVMLFISIPIYISSIWWGYRFQALTIITHIACYLVPVMCIVIIILQCFRLCRDVIITVRPEEDAGEDRKKYRLRLPSDPMQATKNLSVSAGLMV